MKNIEENDNMVDGKMVITREIYIDKIEEAIEEKEKRDREVQINKDVLEIFLTGKNSNVMVNCNQI